MAREWRSKRVVERDRKASRRLVVLTSASVVLLSAITLLVLPAGWRHPSSSTPAPSSLPAANAAPPHVTVAKGAVSIDGVAVGDTSAIEASLRVQRIDGLFDAMKRRRELDLPSVDGSSARTVDVEVASDVPAVVVKSVVQTLAFAGYADVRFVVLDAAAP